jgi:hypothetical protein
MYFPKFKELSCFVLKLDAIVRFQGFSSTIFHGSNIQSHMANEIKLSVSIFYKHLFSSSLLFVVILPLILGNSFHYN